ncbi:hypothetical protein IAE19_03330 [Acinetobacter sp. S40]|uniref:hypothetical protein n=1 Tax=unclassified Acinetobacter TaxID=196816 RepID=UPI00190A0E43|nr:MULTISPECIES: hypothetical protein [unclassified Acinetobacter]MBJ9984469.1 hypothetical protein [Acinetobacter sp. S40]MBK0062186.1 hypothetical protein [Acinetobacter sp. S55]MBK0065990.1 hypothetical protein [Acinetobacter sp. S54]
MTEVRFITMPVDELVHLMDQVCQNAVKKALADQNDELLTITELTKRIPGLTWHTFNGMRKKHKLKDIRGKYSLKAVKAMLQSD